MTAREVSGRMHLYTVLALIALAILSIGCAHLSLGAFAIPVALAIALVKASLVVMFFMHLVEQRATNTFVLLTAGGLLVVLIALASADVATRGLPEVVPPAVGQ